MENESCSNSWSRTWLGVVWFSTRIKTEWLGTSGALVSTFLTAWLTLNKMPRLKSITTWPSTNLATMLLTWHTITQPPTFVPESTWHIYVRLGLFDIDSFLFQSCSRLEHGQRHSPSLGRVLCSLGLWFVILARQPHQTGQHHGQQVPYEHELCEIVNDGPLC